jgi:putative membrane-bound dehydrogenase-like protein
MRSFLMVLISLFAIAGAAEPQPPRLSVLFLGDRGHHRPVDRYGDIKLPLAERGIAVTYTENLDELTPGNLAAYDVLLVYANIPGVSAAQEQAILDFVASGHGFVPVHCASACFGRNPELVKLIGARFKSHGTATFRSRIVDRDHPLMRGFGGFDAWDETYVHDQHVEAGRTVLMERVDGDVHEPYTWVSEHGKGRVFYTAHGHDQRTWTAPGFQDLIARGIAWAAGAKGQPVLDGLLGGFAEDRRGDFAYDDRPTVQNYEKRVPYPQYQQPLTPDLAMRHLIAEHGFEVSLFAAEPDIVKPIAMAWDHRGRLWIAETVDYPSKFTELWQGHDRITICEDTDGDGRADKFTVFADHLNIPTGLVFANGGLIVTQAPYLLFLKDTDGDDHADVREVLMTGWSKGDTHAGPSNLHYGLDNRIYGAVGYAGFSGKRADGSECAFRSGLWRMDRSGADLRFISQYSNNTWGCTLSETGEIFGSTANDTKHCYTPIPIPYLERTAGLEDPELRKAVRMDSHYAADAVTEKIRQVDFFGGFTAAAGHNLYTARAFPQRYWNNSALVCEPTMHLLHQGFLERSGSGWTEGTDGGNLVASDDQWFAPVHAEVGPDGGVWVADWYNFIIQHNPTPRREHGGFDAATGQGGAHVNPLRDETHGRIYRIVARGAKAGRTGLDPAKPDELLAALADDNLFWRLTAQRLLVEHGDRAVVPRLVVLARDQAKDAIGLNGAAVAALWTLQGLGALDGADQAAFAAAVDDLRHPSAGVRRNAVQVLPATSASASAVAASGILADADPNVRLAAFLAVSLLPPSESLGAQLFEQSHDPVTLLDPYLPLALRIAAAQHGQGFLAAQRRAGTVVPVGGDDRSVQTNIAPNPGFEELEGANPKDWAPATYGGAATFAVEPGGRSGRCIRITAEGDGADVGWLASIRVKPRTRYRFSGWVKTDHLVVRNGAAGALFNIHGSDDRSRKALQGTTDWTELVMEFSSGPRESVEVNCLFGGWGLATGSAWYDDLSLVQIGADESGLPASGSLERLVARNLAGRIPLDDQLGLVRQLAAGDPGTAEQVLAGLADGWEGRALPEELGERHRQALAAAAGTLPPGARAHLGRIAARWVGPAALVARVTGPKLPADELARFASGRTRYATVCIACHQPDGRGLPNLAPALAGSEWVTGSPSRLARIVLHGLQGPVTAAGAGFTAPVVMPPHRDLLDDAALAEILTYVRNEWGNTAAAVHADDVKEIRRVGAGRSSPWTIDQLQALP